MGLQDYGTTVWRAELREAVGLPRPGGSGTGMVIESVRAACSRALQIDAQFGGQVIVIVVEHGAEIGA
jgi:hypothetical protein